MSDPITFTLDGKEVTARLVEGVGDSIDLSAFSGRWSLNLAGTEG